MNKPNKDNEENQAEKFYNIGRAYHKKGRLNHAIDFYSNSIKIRMNIKSLTARARCHADLENEELALSDISKAIEFDPCDSELFHERGILTRNLEDLNRAIELNPYNIRAYNNRGNLGGDSYLGDFETSIQLCNNKLQIDVTNSELYYFRGWAKERIGDPRGAIQDFSTSIELDPFENRALFCRSELNLKLGDEKAAIEDLSRVIQNSPWNARAYIKRSEIYQSLGCYELEVRDLKIALENIPFDFYKHLNLGIAYENIDNIYEAIQIYTQLIEKLKPNKALAAYFHRAKAYLRIKDYSAANVDVSTCIELALNKVKNKPQAYKFTQRPLARYYELRGEIFMKNGRLEEALLDSTKALKIYKNLEKTKIGQKYQNFDLRSIYLKRIAIYVLLDNQKLAFEELKSLKS